MICTGALYQWAGRGTPSMFCILEGSANMRAASAGGGRQLTSEPPMQLWGAAAGERDTSVRSADARTDSREPRALVPWIAASRTPAAAGRGQPTVPGTSCCVLHAANRMLCAVRCVLHAACCVLRARLARAISEWRGGTGTHSCCWTPRGRRREPRAGRCGRAAHKHTGCQRPSAAAAARSSSSAGARAHRQGRVPLDRGAREG